MMAGNTSGVATLLKKEAPPIFVTHYLLHRRALPTKTLPRTLNSSSLSEAGL